MPPQIPWALLRLVSVVGDGHPGRERSCHAMPYAARPINGERVADVYAGLGHRAVVLPGCVAAECVESGSCTSISTFVSGLLRTPGPAIRDVISPGSALPVHNR